MIRKPILGMTSVFEHTDPVIAGVLQAIALAGSKYPISGGEMQRLGEMAISGSAKELRVFRHLDDLANLYY